MIHIDFETRSKIDLKKCGAHKYAEDPSTEILCLAYKVNDEPTKIFKRETFLKKDLKKEFEQFRNEWMVAHNVGFEFVIWNGILAKRHHVFPIPIENFCCTAAMAAILGLPRSLDGAAKAIGLPIEKDKSGHRLMLKMSQPRKPTKHNRSVWHEKQTDFDRLYEYCIQDVEVEYQLYKKFRGINGLSL
jgi:DNA polymerase